MRWSLVDRSQAKPWEMTPLPLSSEPCCTPGFSPGWKEGSSRQPDVLCGAQCTGRSGPAATELPLDISIIPVSSLSPAKRDFKPHKLSPLSPCSPSLIKIERTHVPISHLLEGCCGVYASSLYTGAKFEYHLHLPGRQRRVHQKHTSAPLLSPSARLRVRQTR